MRYLIATLVFVSGCAAQSECGYECGDFARRHITEYPYAASPEKASQIRRGYARIMPGMTVRDVKAILGEPDEVNLVMRVPTDKAHSVTGHAYWYVLHRKVASGSVLERDEALVRVTFSLEGQVTKVDHWGFDGT